MGRPQVVHQPPPGVVVSDLLTIKGREAAHRWLRGELGLPLRLNYVRAAVTKGEMPSVKKGVHYFSTRALFDWTFKFSEVAS